MITVILFILIIVLIYITGWYNEIYWKKRGVVFHSTNRVTGPLWEFLINKKPMFQAFNEIYYKYPDAPAVGIGIFLSPTIYVRHARNAQHVLQSDFHSFTDRDIDVNENDLLGNNLLFMNGNSWKLVRQHMTPLFTSAKLKNMYYIIDKSAQDFIEYLKKNPHKLKGNAFDTLSYFCYVAISAAVFGIGSGSTFDSPLLKMLKNAFLPNWKRNIKFAIASTFNGLFRILKINFFKEHEELFIGTIKQVLRQREKENVKRYDFAELCVNLQKNGVLKDNETGLELIPTDELLAAQGFFFYAAGVEPTATALFGTLHELGKQKTILDKVHKEIDVAYQKYNGNMTMETINELEYLEIVLNEGLRMYPPVGNLRRKCTKDSVLPEGNIKIDKGTVMIVPLYEICHDPEFWPNPEIFYPERFLNKKHNDLAYYPFGKGNRVCIGLRYAKLQVKAGLFYILRHFTINSKTMAGGLKYRPEPILVRLTNVDFEFVPRNM